MATSESLFYERCSCRHTNLMPPPRHGGEGFSFVFYLRCKPNYTFTLSRKCVIFDCSLLFVQGTTLGSDVISEFNSPPREAGRAMRNDQLPSCGLGACGEGSTRSKSARPPSTTSPPFGFCSSVNRTRMISPPGGFKRGSKTIPIFPLFGGVRHTTACPGKACVRSTTITSLSWR